MPPEIDLKFDRTNSPSRGRGGHITEGRKHGEWFRERDGGACGGEGAMVTDKGGRRRDREEHTREHTRSTFPNFFWVRK